MKHRSIMVTTNFFLLMKYLIFLSLIFLLFGCRTEKVILDKGNLYEVSKIEARQVL